MKHTLISTITGLSLVVTNTAWSAVFNINIQSFAYTPSPVSINIGDTVTWTNHDGATHSTTDNNNAWASDLSPGNSFSYTFNNPGTYNYFCRFHPGMVGTVEVAGQGTTDPMTCLFSWAETNYPQLFAPAGNPGFQTFPPYTYRYYTATNSYLAFSSTDSNVHYMLGAEGVVQDAGPAADWLNIAGCNTQ